MKHVGHTDLITTQVQIELAELYICIPCTVTNVVGELKNQRVDVQPLINTLYKDGTEEEEEQILGVPIIFPGSMTSLISWPINVGDTVLCVFSQRSMDNFKIGNGQATIPSDYRKMNRKDAIAIPGLVPFSKSLNNPGVRKWPHNTNDLVIAHNVGTNTEIEIRLTESGNLVITTDMDAIVNAKNVTVNAQDSIELNSPLMTVNVSETVWAGNITHTGNYTMTGMATFNGILFDTHFHSGVVPGGGSSGPVAG